MLALQGDDGQWDGGTFFPSPFDDSEKGQPWTATTFSLPLLRDLGLKPDSEEARSAVKLVRENSRWEEGNKRFFEGHSRPRSMCSKGCWNTNAPPAGHRRRSQPGGGARSTCWSGGLLRRESTGELIDWDWLQFSYPTRWFCDVLRDYFRAVGSAPDERMAEAVEVRRSKRQPDCI